MFTHWNVPVAPIAHCAPAVHDGKLPHRQPGVPPAIPTGVVQALALVASHAIPQPLQFMNDGSVRPSVPGATVLLMHVVPQQRCVELHVGMHIPGGPESTRGTLPSVGGGGRPASPVRMHAPLRQLSPAAHRTPHEPQFIGSTPVFAHELPPPVALAQHIWKPLHAGEHTAPGWRSSLAHAATSIETAKTKITAA